MKSFWTSPSKWNGREWKKAHSLETGWMSARTDAVSQEEAGKMPAPIILRYVRLSSGECLL
jgi:hypothetical protein